MNVLDTKELDLVTDDMWNGRREQKSVCVLKCLHYGMQLWFRWSGVQIDLGLMQSPQLSWFAPH